MARYRSVDVRVWTDEKFLALSAPKPNGQTLWFHLLFGPHTGILPGLSRVGEAQIAEQLDWPLAAFRRCWREVQVQGMADADWGARVVFVPKRIRYPGAAPDNANVVTSWRAEWDEIPACPLKFHAWEVFRAHMVRRDEEAKRRAEEEGKTAPKQSFVAAFDKACPRPNLKSPQAAQEDGSGKGSGNGRRNRKGNGSRNGSPDHPENPPGNCQGNLLACARAGQEQEQEPEKDQELDPLARASARGGESSEEVHLDRSSRPGRIGVGDPAFEAVEHWRREVWPKVSTDPCPTVTAGQVSRLRDLCRDPGWPTVKAAMDRAALDPFYAPKLDLPLFLGNFGKFLARQPAVMAATGTCGRSAVLPASQRDEFQGGDRTNEF